MSNSISLMLSCIFLTFSIILSGELISYQQDNAKFINEVTSMSIRVQKTGVDSSLYDDVITQYHFKQFEIDYDEIDKYYSITCTKEHQSLTSLFEYFSKEMKYSVKIYI